MTITFNPNLFYFTTPSTGPSTIGAVGGTWHEL